jgi:hypothetical protein
MITITPTELRVLLKRGKLTGAAAAKIAGVNSRTVRRWIGGESAIPYSAWKLISDYVERMEMEAEARADHTAWIAAQDAATLNERIWTLRGIQQMQSERVARMEDDLAEMRRELADTTSKLNALYVERGKLEQ